MEYLSPKYKNAKRPIYYSIQKKRKVLVISHFHEAIELIKVNSGKVECCVGLEKNICNEGDIVFIPSYAVHGVMSLSENAEIQGLTFETSAIAGEDFNNSLNKILSKDRIRLSIYRSGVKINAFLDKMLSKIENLYNLDNVAAELEIQAALCQIIATLVKEYDIDAEAKQDIDRLQPVIEYIRNNFCRTIHISELSDLLNVCDDHLIRIFKTIMNVTPMRYINNMRLEAAQKMLTNLDLSVTEISYTVGFSSVNYMSKVFTESLGLTPSQYRKNNR